MSRITQLQAFLDSARVSTEVFKLRPDYRVLLMIVDNITPAASDDLSERLLQEAEAFARTELTKTAVTNMPHISAWREAYKAFGAKPQKTRNSLEALTRRVEAGLPRVNRLTDIYNAISVKHQIPFGGENLDKYSGPPQLIRATGKENFETTANGEDVVEHPDVGEIVWCDDAGVTCRRWNWRQGTRTALHTDTKSVLFVLDVLEPVTDEAVTAAADEVISALKQQSPDIIVARRLIDASQGQ